MKNKLRQFGVALGIFTATAVITYAASSLIPTYAPGTNPSDLATAPLVYKMAGEANPDDFDYANDSLKAIGEKLDTMDTKMDSLGGGADSSILAKAILNSGFGGSNVAEIASLAYPDTTAVTVSKGSSFPADKTFCYQNYTTDNHETGGSYSYVEGEGVNTYYKGINWVSTQTVLDYIAEYVFSLKNRTVNMDYCLGNGYFSTSGGGVWYPGDTYSGEMYSDCYCY